MSIGVDLDFLKNSNDISSDPMKDLIDQAFCRATSIPTIPERMGATTLRWEIDWRSPLPERIYPYWEMVQVS
jgi:hypothetical protein